RGFAEAEHTIEGSLTIGGQEHFYLESQIAVAFPGEHGQVMVHSSTQHPTECQNLIAEVLGVDFNRVTVTCKRMGGAFGGKETQAAQPCIMAALVATKLRRPARLFISKDDDMRWTGKRNPFKGFYKVGFDSAGRITAFDLKLFSDGGWSCDLSPSVLERAMMHSDNAYYLPNFRVSGRICRTNLPSNTAFRGFGGPQGVVNIENVMEEIALTLGMDALEVRRRNLYGIGERNTTPYEQTVENNMLPKLIDELSASAGYPARRTEIDRFNRSSNTQLRGLAMTFVKFGISFSKKTLNQANALVNIYTDGSVFVSTGGTEIGQGVNTRVRQIVADELGITYDSLIVGATNTDKNCNTSPTAASSGTDLNGAAAQDACRRLRQRLADFAAKEFSAPAESIVFDNGEVYDRHKPDHRIAFRELICRAYIERINL